MAEATSQDPGLADDLRALGVDPARVDSAELFYEGHGSRLYRVAEGARSCVLKRSGAPGKDGEMPESIWRALAIL